MKGPDAGVRVATRRDRLEGLSPDWEELPQLVVERDQASQQALVRVRDNGIGISSEMLPRVFDLFAQADAGRSERGLGIGLTLARRIVEMHGGKLEGASGGLGQGIEFCIRLPIVKSAT